MNFKKILITFAVLLPASLAFADTGAPVKVDNSALNARDASHDTLTPTDQSKGTKSDVELTRKIRRLVTKDGSLSTKAHNVKIITLNGVTTLRGPVNTVEESQKIENFATKVVGVNSVKNDLEVKAND
jgi:hyperosmotically inducible protein